VLASTSAGLNGTTATADLERVTILGSNQKPADATAIGAEADGAGKTGSVTARDSIMTGFQNSILRQGSNDGLANVTTDRSVYLSSGGPGLDTGTGSLTETNRLTVSPRFVNPAANDFRLAADSPLIDAGTPGDLPAGSLDRDGKPRQSDGNGDCSHVGDIGAFEFQGTSVKAVARAVTAVEFSSEGSCIPGPGTPTVKWSFDDGATADGATVSHAFATPGKHTAVATVSDDSGHQASASAEVEVAAVPKAPPAVAPAITKLRVKGKAVTFRLSKAAKVNIRFAQIRKHGKVKRIKASLRVNGKAGANRAKLPRRLRHLKPGSYRLTAVATSADGARSKARTVRFKVAKAKAKAHAKR
jgi:PKD domain